jgi:hypothetical protein
MDAVMSDAFSFFENQPFLSGLLLGLTCTAVVWVRELILALSRKREVTRLKELLQTKLEVEARAQRGLHDELDALRKQNENLRVTVKTLQQKPDRTELRQLYVYDAAVRALLSKSPGFGPAWQTVLNEAELQIAETETGLRAFVRRALSPRPVRQLPEPPDAVDDDDRKKSDD